MPKLLSKAHLWQNVAFTSSLHAICEHATEMYTGTKTASEVSMPAARSDTVAESLLDCCTALLLRCPAQSGEQLLLLMDRFASIASLNSNTAAEEVSKCWPPGMYKCCMFLQMYVH